MDIDLIYENKILCEFVYSPLREMQCALHVLCDSSHHLHRKKWVDKVNEKIDGKLKKQLKEFGEITMDFLISMDFTTHFKECNQLDILSSIDFLIDVPFYKINKMFKEYKKTITSIEYHNLLDFLKVFYIEVFREELKYIEPLLIRILKRKSEYAKENGVFNFIDTIHERIKIEDGVIIFYKYKEFRFQLKDIKNITIYISTFISPHLLLGYEKKSIDLTMLVELQEYEKTPPIDLEKRLKAIGDGTRLRILKEIGTKGKTTQELSIKLNISEAAVSKALKLLYDSKLVDKTRAGNYIIYNLNTIEIDYLPYKIYEYLM